MELANKILNEIVRQQVEYTEKSLAEIVEKYDFIVCSTACMNQLQEILPEGAKIAYSPYIGDPATIYVIKKFDMMDLLDEALNKKETPKREEISEAVSYIKAYRKLDENLHNTAPKGSVGFYATEKCLRYWDMAIEALEKDQSNPKTGHWVKFVVNGQHKIRCDMCDYTEAEYVTHIRNYCPNCGIKMEDKEEK